jgi:hypothetical protein
MSKGPGAIEKRIAELIAETRDRGLSVAEMADHAFQLAGQPALRAQRLSATRAGHRLLRRMREAEQKRLQLISDAKAAVGEPSTREYPPNLAAYKAAQKVYNRAVARYDAALKATEPWRLAEKFDAYVDQFGSWVRSSSMEICRRATSGNTGASPPTGAEPSISTRRTSRSGSGPSRSSAQAWSGPRPTWDGSPNATSASATPAPSHAWIARNSGSIGRCGTASISFRAAAAVPRNALRSSGRKNTDTPTTASSMTLTRHEMRDHAHTLSDFLVPTLSIECEPCGRRGR